MLRQVKVKLHLLNGTQLHFYPEAPTPTIHMNAKAQESKLPQRSVTCYYHLKGKVKGPQLSTASGWSQRRICLNTFESSCTNYVAFCDEEAAQESCKINKSIKC